MNLGGGNTNIQSITVVTKYEWFAVNFSTFSVTGIGFRLYLNSADNHLPL